MSGQEWPCRRDPERWFARDRRQLGLAIHACRSHCPRLRECGDTEAPPVDGVLAGVLFTTAREVDLRQPEPVRCDACLTPVVEPVDTCGVGAREHRRRGERCVPCQAKESREKNRIRKPRRKALPVDVFDARRRALDEALRGAS